MKNAKSRQVFTGTQAADDSINRCLHAKIKLSSIIQSQCNCEKPLQFKFTLMWLEMNEMAAHLNFCSATVGVDTAICWCIHLF